MKIKTKQLDYASVLALPRKQHKLPQSPSRALAALIRTLTAGDLKDAAFTYTSTLPPELDGVPCLILMNHSSFIDLELVAQVFQNRPYNIICTSDGFVGKEWLMRAVGCVPTQKFVRDVTLIQDMEYCLHTLKTSVLMYPEASYTFDGCATPLPRKLGVLLKKLGVPVIGVKTHGAFLRDPLYNCLQKRKVTVSAEVSCLFTPETIKATPARELDAALDAFFTFDGFREQQEQGLIVDAPFRADGLNRILYKCDACGAEEQTEGKGTRLRCKACGREHELTPEGRLTALTGEPRFSHIPDWFRWEREQLREALLTGTYSLETDVEIGVMVDYKAIYMVGEGHLSHSAAGFRLTGCDGLLDYSQSPLACYSLYSDYYWYELGDMICIGDNDILYYCFPKGRDIAARTRLAAEELYKLALQERRSPLRAEK